MDMHKTKKILNTTIDKANKEYLDNLKQTKSINISRYVNELITNDKKNKSKKYYKVYLHIICEDEEINTSALEYISNLNKSDEYIARFEKLKRAQEYKCYLDTISNEKEFYYIKS